VQLFSDGGSPNYLSVPSYPTIDECNNKDFIQVGNRFTRRKGQKNEVTGQLASMSGVSQPPPMSQVTHSTTMNVTQVSQGFSQGQIPSFMPPPPPPTMQEVTTINIRSARFAGTQWGIRGYATNTCPVDSMVNAMYMPYRAGQLLSDYPALDDQNSLLSRTFKYLDSDEYDEGRKLWITPFYGEATPSNWLGVRNLYGSIGKFYSRSELKFQQPQHIIEHHPLSDCFQSIRHIYKRCNKTGGCASNKRTYKGIPCQELHFSPVTSFTLQDNVTAENFWYSQDIATGIVKQRCTATGCDGQIVEKAGHIDFAHTIVLSCSANKTASSLTPSFKCEGSKFILRSIILHSEEKKHFVSLNRHAKGWILYDGLGVGNTTYRYMNYPTNLVDEAMGTFKFGIAMYETAPENESRLEGNLRGKQDFTDHFAYENYTPSPTPGIVGGQQYKVITVDSEDESSSSLENGDQDDDKPNSNGGQKDEARKVRFSLDSNSLVNEDQDDDKPNSIAASNSDDNYSAGL
jgi:hypothetical protein